MSAPAAGLVASPEDQAVVRAVVDLAAGLRMLVVAEGVETAAQADLLRRLGCQYGQGYLFAQPLDPSAADAYVRRSCDTATPRQRAPRAPRRAARVEVLAC